LARNAPKRPGRTRHRVVHVALSAGYNFTDTGSHEAFGFNAGGTVSDLAPNGYVNTGAFTQSGFGNFQQARST
jgi:hypothetical protein